METPYFLIHRDSMEENLSSFRQALEEEWGEGRIAYSVKTNACAYVLSFMKAQGVLAEVVSDDEYMLAGDLGFSPQEIVFNGPIKGKALFLQAVIEGAFVHIDSRRELSWLEELPEGQVYPVGLRVNLDLSPLCPEDVGLEKEGYRFGFSYENGDFLWALERLSACRKVRLSGLHFHCNSITRSPAVYGHMAEKAAELLEKYDLDVEYVDMGGGFFGGVPGKPTAKTYISTFTGQLPYPQMVSTLCLCDFAVNPIRKGAASIINKVGDYAAAALGVINTQECEEYKRLLREYGAGIHCENGDGAALERAIETLYAQKERREAMGRGNRRLAEERFDRGASYETLCALIEQAGERKA